MVTGFLTRATRFFGTFRFPAFAISLLVFFHVAVATSLLVPAGMGGRLGALADDVRVWCFGWDAATGRYEVAYMAMVVVEPLVLGAGIALFWWQPLRDVLRSRPRVVVPHALTALGIVAFAATAAVFSQPARAGEAPLEGFRTDIPSPTFRLTAQSGRTVTSEDFRGRVVVLTGVYAHCGATCPMILGQAKRAIAALRDDEKRDVTIVAVTLDPERDRPESLADLARAQSVGEPRFQLLTGDAGEVNELLDRIGVVRKRDPESGVIDHTNVFAVVDRKGRLAYRFSLGEREEARLVRAIRSLVAEGG